MALHYIIQGPAAGAVNSDARPLDLISLQNTSGAENLIFQSSEHCVVGGTTPSKMINIYWRAPTITIVIPSIIDGGASASQTDTQEEAGPLNSGAPLLYGDEVVQNPPSPQGLLGFHLGCDTFPANGWHIKGRWWT